MLKRLIPGEPPILEEWDDEWEEQRQQCNSNHYPPYYRSTCAPGYVFCKPYHLLPQTS
jgi:hypothetical protein